MSPPLSEVGKSLPEIQVHLGVLGDHVAQGDLSAESQMVTGASLLPTLYHNLLFPQGLIYETTPHLHPSWQVSQQIFLRSAPPGDPGSSPPMPPFLLSYYISVLIIHSPHGLPEPLFS